MRNLISLFVTVLAYLIFLSSCEEGNERKVTPTPDATQLKFFIDSKIAANEQYLTLDAGTGGMLLANKGTILQFQENSFADLDGNVVTGEVEIKLIEIFDRSDMAFMKKPTMGRDLNGDLSALKSGGQFFIDATQGAKKLKPIREFTFIVPVENTGGADEQMLMFTGVEECDGTQCNVIWEQDAGDRGNVGVDGFQDAGGVRTAYYAFRNKFGWTNIDRWYSDPRPKTTVFVDVPKGFNNANCAVFMAYKGEPASLAMFDKFDSETEMFTEHYGMVPVGLEVHFILVSFIDGTINYAIQSATIQENHTQTISKVTPISEADLVSLINGLP